VQETFISVVKNIRRLDYDRRRGTFKGWLPHTTRWKIADIWRKRKNHVLA